MTYVTTPGRCLLQVVPACPRFRSAAGGVHRDAPPLPARDKERDSYLAHVTAAFVPLPEVPSEEIAPTARPNPLPTRAFTLDDALKCSGGETRTLNLAGPLEQDQHQHPLG